MRELWDTLKAVTAGTWIRTALLALALINQLLTILGLSPLPVSDEQLAEMLSLLFTAVASLAAWWKNNSFSKAALTADDYMHALKEE